MLIAFGDGVVAMAVAALNQSGRGEQIFAASGDWLLIAWGWALAVAFGVYVAGGISGAHINPAVTLAMAVKRGFPPRANLAPLLVGLAVVAIGMSFGANAGYAINPARDFGPRTFAWLAGWGQVAVPGVHGYMWVPIIGPLIGGLVGAVVYDFFIRDVLRAREEPSADVEVRGETVEDEPAGSRSGGAANGRTVRRA